MVATRCRIVGYLRTSTDDQRLGIEAQRATLDRLAAERGCEVVRIFVEHESGGDNTRRELDKAVEHVRRVKASELVAKLDRLARNYSSSSVSTTATCRSSSATCPRSTAARRAG
jgi:DNA invertase Pin-like site-specific DNA recombinase